MQRLQSATTREIHPRGQLARPLSKLVLPLLLAIGLLDATLARAVMQNIGGPAAIRVTSTASLSPPELKARELQGSFRNFLGTPVYSNYFVTAQHIGIDAGDTIAFASGPNAGVYPILGWHDDPGSDLRLVEISGTFTEWALLYAAADEMGREAIIFGRGGAPNGQVLVNAELKGWTTAAADGAIAWGRNVITGSFGADQVYARFDQVGLATEAGLSVGDSGGAWFVTDGQGVSRLAAISFAVTGPFQQDAGGSPDGNAFEAGLFDIGGLWLGNPGSETFVPENPVNVPGVGFATRISDRIDWIVSIVPIPVDDVDGDGVPDSQDNCPLVANASQADNGGLGFGTTPDGIGNACQCGDVTGEGQVNDVDATFIKQWALGLDAFLFLVPDNCDVTGEGTCNGSDATAIRHAATGSPPAIFGQNCPNALP